MPYFIFYDRKHKIIPTILLVVVFDFKRITVKMPRNILLEATSQGVVFEDDALHIIAQKQMVRDALSILTE
jgi:DNA polymerase-3 subunit gamma/tau